MADFERARDQLRQTRSSIERTVDALAAARARVRRIKASAATQERGFTPQNPRDLEARARLERDARAAEAEVKRHLDELTGLRLDEVQVLEDFSRFSDPRAAIARLSDDTPILLMPVRVETRFRNVDVAGAAAVRQLWVRIYPDDCWIDTFDPTLTDSELVNARTYWTAIWEAGGHEDQERAAWRALVSCHGSGRASWIVRQYKPSNLPAPAKPQPQDVILTIPVEAALPATEEAAAIAYWRAAWLADGDRDKTEQARRALEAAVGSARAAQIVDQVRPANFAAPLPSGTAKTDVNLQVAFVVLPPIETKTTAWARAPKAAILPDRFAFVGYGDGAEPLVAIGNQVQAPLFVGPDPSADPADQIKHDSHGNLVVPDELAWMTDFDRAVAVGMGLRITLSDVQARTGFRRVLVIGLRVSSDRESAAAELETLLAHHSFSRSGFSIVPQGTPTNNTEAAPAGHSRVDDPDESFDDLKAPQFVSTSRWLDKRDGQWLAEYLGIDPGIVANVHDAGATDQIAGRAMNAALWPATLGYWMETMMAPVFTRDAIERTRQFFCRFVLGAGSIPAIRIGSQPYGILPATAFSRLAWLDQAPGPTVADGPERAYVRRLYPLLTAIGSDLSAKLAAVSFTAKPGDPHQLLLDIVGLHPGSVEWSERDAENIRTLYNRLALLGFAGAIEAILTAAEREAARQLLVARGYADTKTPPILDLVFTTRYNILTGGVVDDVPLSESQAIRAYTTDNRNYIRWLIDAARTSLDAVYRQEGFTDDTPPAALLFLLLRHAVQLGYHDVGIRLYELAGLLTPEAAVLARSDDPFIHIRTASTISESRYQPLYATQPRITGSATQTVQQFIATDLTTIVAAGDFRGQLDALERLVAEPTARLERAFADHVDCCAYRLDAWLLGLVTYQLTLMRGIAEAQETQVRRGVHLGAYAWLENVRPEAKTLTPVVLTDPALAADFADPAAPPLMRDSANEGYIHAPSLNQAVAAAVLRNGFISDASTANRDTLAVNVTSARVRTALAMLDGVRGGQGLADLLGYQFERGLHDAYGLAEVDKFIFKLRKAFPLRADRMQSTRTGEGVPIESIEARNVIDGLQLVEHLKTGGNRSYPFGRTDLPSATSTEAAAIDAEVERLLDTHDAVADLALAEGVYQAVVGNYDRVAATYDAYARGNFPPQPDVVRTPMQGVGLTHRVALHLESGADPAVSPLPGIGVTPRSQAEPALNRWLASVLPASGDVGCVVSFKDAATGATAAREVTLANLAIQPADIVAIVREDAQQAMTELDDRIIGFVVDHFGARPDAPMAIQYMATQTAPISFFQLMPLVRSLRRLTAKSRPLRATDLMLANEAQRSRDDQVFIDRQRISRVRTSMQDLADDVAAYKARVDAPLADLPARRAEILADVDDYIADLTPLLQRAALFGVPQAGWGFAYDFRRRTFGAILRQASDLVSRWDDRLAEFDRLIAAHDALPPAATDQERFDLLVAAERAISTDVTAPLPSTPAAFRAALIAVKRPAFVAARDQFAALQSTTRTRLSSLRNDVAALLPITAFDTFDFSLTRHDDETVRFAADIVSVCGTVIAALTRRLADSQTLLDRHDAAAEAADRVRALEAAAKVLLGDDARIFPEFVVQAAQAAELQNALNASRSGALFHHLTHPADPAADPLDFPVDTWLYGVARVREPLRAWEHAMMTAGSLGRPEPELDPMQLPFVPGEGWLGLELPPGSTVDVDHLLYTAHFAVPFDPAARICGLLIDEWTETIPGSTADTGVTFHFDRPNCEAPQTMLLVTPAAFTGAWRWEDLVDALNDTLDLAKRRAIEPKHIDELPYAVFLPATVAATQARELTIAANLALNNRVALTMQS